MDPTQLQADSSNDSHSLEQVDETAKSKDAAKKPDEDKKTTEDGVTDATGGSTAETPPPPPKQSFIKKLWQKFNIYLLLFALLIVVAIGVLIMSIVKSKQASQHTLTSQGLSQEDLKQLATTDVSVGSPKQVLTVQANAVFAGGVLVRSNLDVAGSLRVGGSLSLSDLSVSGITQLGDTQVNNLNVAGAINLAGALNIKNGLSVSGNTNFSGSLTATSITTGSLQLNGDLNLTHHITAGGTIPNVDKGAAVGGGGTVSVSGSDTSGSITINTGSNPPAGCLVSITFSQKFSSTPHVTATPIGSGGATLQYYVNRSTTGFEICTANSAPSGTTFGFDYIALD